MVPEERAGTDLCSLNTHRSSFLPFQQQMTAVGTCHMLWTPEFRRSEALTDFLNEESTNLHPPLAFLLGFLLL